MGTVYKAIVSDKENFEIHIIKHRGKWIKEPALQIFEFREDMHIDGEEYLWDNHEYLIELYKTLKNKKKKSDYYKEFKTFCKVHQLVFKEMRKEFIDLMKQAKKEKFFQYKL